MQSFYRSLISRQSLNTHFKSAAAAASYNVHQLTSLISDSASKNQLFRSFQSHTSFGSAIGKLGLSHGSVPVTRLSLCSLSRNMTTAGNPAESASAVPSQPLTEVSPRIKFKRLDKTARHIMQILDKEAVSEVRTQREIPDIRPGQIVQLKVEVPENKRRISTVKGIVIARRNSGISTTFRLRRLVAGVGIESLFPLYSPNIKEITILEQKKVRRAKLYYLRDKMNALKKK
ncbi:50S ribosomal protein L19, chloroplastic-like [Mercurialis annua]|uniref:50S ribosomal protein L19, chloroplastic-like n=1 Tax=Mercurialis annua TaxID=3986 RepID=UPI00215F776C|nr:50S ribosomal protein L19, chloroplastic-like [Mercurialis annua]